MFVFSRAIDGEDLDPRDVPPVPTTSLWRSQQARFASVFNARVEALAEVDQLRLAEEAAACKAVVEWTHCKLASSLALKDLSSPLVRAASERSGGCHLIQMAGPGTPPISEGIVTELALALSRSERVAHSYIAVGLDLRFRLRCNNNEFGGGRISFAHAQVISEATRLLSEDLAEQLDEKLADAAATRTPGRLRVLARRLVGKADPDGLRKRHAAAMAERSASIFPLGDGIGAFSFNHQLEVTAVIDDQLDTWARRRRGIDTETPFAAHKADAAALLLLGRHPMTGADLLGPVGLASTFSDPSSGIAPSPSTDTWTGPSTGTSTGSLTRSATVPQTVPVASPVALLPVRTEIRVTMGADTLLGLDDQTCELDGYGPITAEQARRLALQSSSTVLRRLFTDSVDDSVMTMDARAYRFTTRQEDAVRAIHPISCFPGATTPAGRCDTDHRRPYRHPPPGHLPEAGQTVAVNGQPLGRRNHRVRTHLGWESAVDPNDAHTIYWTSPHGRLYTVHDHDGA